MSENQLAISARHRVIIVGAGIAGLATAARLAHGGHDVVILERHSEPGGKIRCLPSIAGPVDTGPTVLTLRSVFEDLFNALGESIENHVDLIPQKMIARHFWHDGSRLDLYDDDARNFEAIYYFAGIKAARQFTRFTKRARQLFEGFDAPMMRASEPSFPALAKHVAMRPALALQMAPFSTLDKLLRRSFDDPRLVQLFGRYATYVGGSPYRAPALLSLIWQAESAGVWAVKGGMHKLANAIAEIATHRGARFQFNADVARIRVRDGHAIGVTLTDGTELTAESVVFNGDPRALSTGSLGQACAEVAPHTRDAPRSLSAEVWAFAAKPQGVDLAHHNVFFRKDPKREFEDLRHGRLTSDPTLYVCAMDRGFKDPAPSIERFEIIANAPPTTLKATEEDTNSCQMRTFQTLAQFGLQFDPMPTGESVTTPHGFERLFPQTAGSLYGQSPHGTMAAFQRPTARTKIKGLYLVGGGAHPGAGIPMATLSAQHAVEAILTDQTSISTFHPTATRGGMSTGSATTVTEP